MPQKSLSETLEHLKELQEVDVRLAELEVSKVFLPKLLNKYKSEIDELEGKIEKYETKLNEIEKEVDLKEMKLDEIKEKIEESQEKLINVETNKEYDAIQKEMSGLKERKVNLESEIIDLMEKQEEYEQKLSEAKEEYEEKEEDTSAEIKKIRNNLDNLEKKVAEVKHEREKIARHLSKRVLSTYDRIRKGKEGGMAIVPVENRACGGCYNALPPQKIQEIKRESKLIFCEGCGRILYWPWEEDEEEEGDEGD